MMELTYKALHASRLGWLGIGAALLAATVVADILIGPAFLGVGEVIHDDSGSTQ